MPAPDLDLDVRPKPAARASKPKVHQEDAPLELAIDPRALVQQRAAPPPPPPPPPGMGGTAGHAALAPAARKPHSLAPAPDLDADARLLADYGDAPSNAVLAPLYAWRVLKRQRELKAALAVRRAEAEHAQNTLDDALVALAERVRPTAEKQTAYRTALDDLARAEEVLRSRDKVLAAEQDAQRGRLAQVDARIAKAEGELAGAQGHERAVATELSAAQGALAREEAKIKRAEAELRAAQQRESGGGASTR
jgi:hypothetical protein